MGAPTQTSQLVIVEQRLSPDRIKTYRRACQGDLDRGLALYRWNLRIAAAFWTILSGVEVIVRNAMDEQLTWLAAKRGSRPWFEELSGLFIPSTLDDIAKARRRAALPTGERQWRVITELSFGFWRYILAVRYDRTLWTPCLHRAFPHMKGRRRKVYDAMSRLLVLRNEIAHNQPIFQKDLAALHDEALRVVGWVCPISRDWLAMDSEVPLVLSQRPA